MRTGRNKAVASVQRRAISATDDRGDFEEVFTTWIFWTQQTGKMADDAGAREDQIDLIGTIRDCQRNRTITNSDRMTIDEIDYQILSVGLPEKSLGYIPLTLKRTMNS